MSKRPLLLDLFCGAGGAAMGYYRAGFDTLGVDIAPQKRYPFSFVQADALEFLAWLIQSGDIAQFAAVHASPPCQRYSSLARLHPGKEYPGLLPATRAALIASGRPWVLENVPGAPMLNPLVICGTALGMQLIRHRHFDSSTLIFAPGKCRHRGDEIAVTGHSIVYAWHSRHRRSPHLGWALAREIMGIDWTTGNGVAQAIPPAYTEWIGRQLLPVVESEPAA